MGRTGLNGRRIALAAGIAGASLGAASAVGWVGGAVYFARLLLTPARDRPDDVTILDVDREAGTITLGADVETLVAGRYGLWFGGGAGHLRLGDIVRIDPPDGDRPGQVVRALERVDSGDPVPGPGRWDGYYVADPPDAAFGLPCRDVVVEGEQGPMPAWLVPARADGPPHGAERWAVLVHGRGATRHECLRALPVLHRLGLTALVPTYRNDPEGPPSPDGLYNLGLSEWRDVEAAMRYALDRGAREIVLVGWSMGGAIVLQTLDRSRLADRVTGVIIDSPVIDWVDVIAHHASLRRIPPPLATLAQGVIGARWARRFVGVHEPLDVAQTSWQLRADELRHRMLLIHSRDDELVPVGPSRELAGKRPDLVRFEEWHTARHVKEWNLDPTRWDRAVAEFLLV